MPPIGNDDENVVDNQDRLVDCETKEILVSMVGIVISSWLRTNTIMVRLHIILT